MTSYVVAIVEGCYLIQEVSVYMRLQQLHVNSIMLQIFDKGQQASASAENTHMVRLWLLHTMAIVHFYSMSTPQVGSM